MARRESSGVVVFVINVMLEPHRSWPAIVMLDDRARGDTFFLIFGEQPPSYVCFDQPSHEGSFTSESCVEAGRSRSGRRCPTATSRVSQWCLAGSSGGCLRSWLVWSLAWCCINSFTHSPLFIWSVQTALEVLPKSQPRQASIVRHPALHPQILLSFFSGHG